MTTTRVEEDVVIVEWSEIQAADTSPELLAGLETALGSTGIGLVAIRGVPDFVETKQSFLPQTHRLVNLPPEYLEDKLTDPASLYNAGWSHGKEKLGSQPDTAKGSFYYNPVTDLPGTAREREQYPCSYPLNRWPDDDVLPGFSRQAKRMGLILKRATVELAKHIDALASQKLGADYPQRFLYRKMKDTDKVKARLLYYFPLAANASDGKNDAASDANETPSEDSWIGWHNDSGFLTALGGDMYVDHETGQVLEECPDPAAGLYVADRQQAARKVNLPADCLAVQIGECTQIVTGGAVRATPHCVRGVAAGSTRSNVARISLPCFVDVPPYEPLALPSSATREQVLAASANSDKVPPLGPRWTGNDMTFGDFLQKTFSMYYEWSPSTKMEEVKA